MPGFLQSDDQEETFGDGLLSGIDTRRRRRQYDERPNEDDAEGEPVSASRILLWCSADCKEMSLEHLGDVKTGSIGEWIAIDQVRRAVQKHFRSFLMTYVDENGQSVYGQRIKALGESEQP